MPGIASPLLIARLIDLLASASGCRTPSRGPVPINRTYLCRHEYLLWACLVLCSHRLTGHSRPTPRRHYWSSGYTDLPDIPSRGVIRLALILPPSPLDGVKLSPWNPGGPRTPVGVYLYIEIIRTYQGLVLWLRRSFTSDIQLMGDFRPQRLTEHETRAIQRLTGHTSHDIPDIVWVCTHDIPDIPVPINWT